DDREIVPRQGEATAVRREGDGTEPPRQPFLQAPGLLARGHVPEADGVVVSGRDEALAVRAEGDGADPPQVPRRTGDDFLAGRRVPEPDEAVRAAGNQRFTVRRVGHGVDRAEMAARLPQLLAGGVPGAEGPVAARRRQGRGGRAEGETRDA